jgi:hypothetical protein
MAMISRAAVHFHCSMPTLHCICIHSTQLSSQTQTNIWIWLQCCTLAQAESRCPWIHPGTVWRLVHSRPSSSIADLDDPEGIYAQVGSKLKCSELMPTTTRWSCDVLHSLGTTLVSHRRQNSPSFLSGHCYGVHFRVHLSPEPVAEWMVEQELVKIDLSDDMEKAG